MKSLFSKTLRWLLFLPMGILVGILLRLVAMQIMQFVGAMHNTDSSVGFFTDSIGYAVLYYGFGKTAYTIVPKPNRISIILVTGTGVIVCIFVLFSSLNVLPEIWNSDFVKLSSKVVLVLSSLFSIVVNIFGVYALSQPNMFNK